MLPQWVRFESNKGNKAMESLQPGCDQICKPTLLIASDSLAVPTGNRAIGPLFRKHRSLPSTVHSQAPFIRSSPFPPNGYLA